MVHPKKDREDRERDTLAVRAKAPLAAIFEDCLQAFDRLQAILEANKKEWRSEFDLEEDNRIRFESWGQHSGASTRALDHRLRNAVELAATTTEHLEDLHSNLVEANELSLAYLTEQADHVSNVHATPSDASEEVGGQDDQIPDDSVAQHLEEVAEIVGCLLDLLPTLRAPVSQRDYEAFDSGEATKDIALAKTMFPKAPGFLIQRLGKANWRRRRILKQARHKAFLSEDDLGRGQSTKQLGSSSHQAKKRAKAFARYRRHVASYAASDAGASTAQSAVETVFSMESFLGGHSMSSIAETDYSSLTPPLLPPDPPENLIPGSSFVCPYCSLEIRVGDQVTTREDWNQHFFLDLEPYLCTFDTCIRPDHTFGIKEQWFRHELYCHRIQKAWYCNLPICKNVELPDRCSFVEHLRSSHHDFYASGQRSVLVQDCERYSEQPLLKQPCLLCGNTCTDSKDLERHLATHLEQFAITATAEGSSSGEESISGDDDNFKTESPPSKFVLDDFMQEDDRYHQSQRQASTAPHVAISSPQNIRVKRSDTEADGFVEIGLADSCNSSSIEENNGAKRSGRKEDLWTGKVEDFLGNQIEATQPEDPSLSPPTIRTNVPQRNVGFIGRTDIFASMCTALSSPGRLCVLSGEGGVGKTSTVTEYAYRCEHDYDYIFWVEAEKPGGRTSSYSLIASELGLGGSTILDQEGLIFLVREYLQRWDKSWLLIFDNAEIWADISTYIPRGFPSSRGSIILTSRAHDLLKPARNTHHLRIEPFTLQESTQLLLCSMHPTLNQDSVQKHPDYALAEEASTLVNCLPLAISMIAGYVQVSKCTLADFLEIWDERQSRSKKSLHTSENEAIDLLWDIGIRELPRDANDLLKILVFLDSQSIPRELLVGDHDEPSLEFLNSSETRRYKRMIAQLSGRKLIQLTGVDGQTLSIHRILQGKILHDLDAETNEVFRKAYCLVRKRFPRASPIQVPEPDKAPACKEHIPHVLTLRRSFLAIPTIEPSLELAQLFYDAGFHIWAELQTAPEEGVMYFQTAEEILNTLDRGPYEKLRADIHSIISLLTNKIGSNFRAECLQRLREARVIRQKILEDDVLSLENDILCTNAASDLAWYLFETWEFEEASKILKECHQKYQKWGSETKYPYEYAKHYFFNARVAMYMGKYAEAMTMFRKALELAEQALGKNWFYFDIKFHLACTMIQAGDLESALQSHLEVRTLRETEIGKYDSASIMSHYAVGAVYYHLGDLPAATQSFERCIQLASESKWSVEALARARFHLSMTYKAQEIKIDDARELEIQAVAVLAEFPVPEYLAGVEDKMILFDDLQPAGTARFTGIALLSHMQKWKKDRD